MTETKTETKQYVALIYHPTVLEQSARLTNSVYEAPALQMYSDANADKIIYLHIGTNLGIYTQIGGKAVAQPITLATFEQIRNANHMLQHHIKTGVIEALKTINADNPIGYHNFSVTDAIRLVECTQNDQWLNVGRRYENRDVSMAAIAKQDAHIKDLFAAMQG
jgi:hypothetical protein